jgi:hypothetical protein
MTADPNKIRAAFMERVSAELVESLCPAPRYADLFSRYRHNDKWDCYGDEAPPYDAAADFAGSLDDCYAAVRERVAAGGKGWEPR